MQMALKGILEPYNMNLEDIEQPSFSSIHILIGNDQLSLQLKDHPGLNEPVQNPEKQWEGFKGLRSAKVIKEEKKKVDWDKVMEIEESFYSARI